MGSAKYSDGHSHFDRLESDPLRRDNKLWLILDFLPFL